MNTPETLDTLLLAAVGAAPVWKRDVRGNAFGFLRLPQPNRLLDAAKALADKSRDRGWPVRRRAAVVA